MFFAFIIPSTPDIIIVLIVALLVFGPQKLPEIGKQVGSALRELNKMRSDVQRALDLDEYTRDTNTVDYGNAYRYDSTPYGSSHPSTLPAATAYESAPLLESGDATAAAATTFSGESHGAATSVEAGAGAAAAAAEHHGGGAGDPFAAPANSGDPFSVPNAAVTHHEDVAGGNGSIPATDLGGGETAAATYIPHTVSVSAGSSAAQETETNHETHHPSDHENAVPKE